MMKSMLSSRRWAGTAGTADGRKTTPSSLSTNTVCERPRGLFGFRAGRCSGGAGSKANTFGGVRSGSIRGRPSGGSDVRLGNSCGVFRHRNARPHTHKWRQQSFRPVHWVPSAVCKPDRGVGLRMGGGGGPFLKPTCLPHWSRWAGGAPRTPYGTRSTVWAALQADLESHRRQRAVFYMEWVPSGRFRRGGGD